MPYTVARPKPVPFPDASSRRRVRRSWVDLLLDPAAGVADGLDLVVLAARLAGHPGADGLPVIGVDGFDER
jgi:hypothetical protein